MNYRTSRRNPARPGRAGSVIPGGANSCSGTRPAFRVGFRAQPLICLTALPTCRHEQRAKQSLHMVPYSPSRNTLFVLGEKTKVADKTRVKGLRPSHTGEGNEWIKANR